MTYNTLITYNRELHSLHNIIWLTICFLYTCTYYIFYNSTQFQTNKEALQYSANNFTQFALIKTYFCVQQHCLVTIMISSNDSFKQKKKDYEKTSIFVDALKWVEIDIRSSTCSIVISTDFLLSLPY